MLQFSGNLPQYL